jgi:hypothetical protein
LCQIKLTFRWATAFGGDGPERLLGDDEFAVFAVFAGELTPRYPICLTSGPIRAS